MSPSFQHHSTGDTVGHQDLAHLLRPTRNQAGVWVCVGAINSALLLIKHLAVTEASPHARCSDTFTIWGNGVPGL